MFRYLDGGLILAVAGGIAWTLRCRFGKRPYKAKIVNIEERDLRSRDGSVKKITCLTYRKQNGSVGKIRVSTRQFEESWPDVGVGDAILKYPGSARIKKLA